MAIFKHIRKDYAAAYDEFCEFCGKQFDDGEECIFDMIDDDAFCNAECYGKYLEQRKEIVREFTSAENDAVCTYCFNSADRLTSIIREVSTGNIFCDYSCYVGWLLDE